uniref:Uncharacterized protein n=1 Tax=Anguilla anguilla TaxID=7936 RepID=A0A0E9WSC5_ANGAN
MSIYGIYLYNFKGSYFSIHADISISTCKKMLPHRSYFMNIVLSLYYVLRSEKRRSLK